MAVVSLAQPVTTIRWWHRLWQRDLESYPTSGVRARHLAITVLATIVLYYQASAAAGVGPLVIGHFHMSFTFFLYISVVSAGLGGFTSLIGGLSDRVGRANIIVAGLVVVSLLTLVGVPNAGSKWAFAVLLVAIGFVEGMVFVAVPAILRDFSPQVSRGVAMGFFTLGPVAGSLIVAIVTTRTLPHLHTWQSQFRIAGWAGIAMSVVAVVALRELSPRIRGQLVVSQEEKMLVEARARGMTEADVLATMAHPWRQVLKLDLLVPAVSIGLYLLIYYAAVGFFVIYIVTTFKNPDGSYFTTSQANGIQQWMWAFNCGALIVVGLVSDRLRVRKPFMVLGAAGSIAMVGVWISLAHAPNTSYYDLVVVVSILATFLGIGFAPWMAAYTETVEDHNPALMATGIAVMSWALRVVIAVSIILVPVVVTSVTPIVDNSAYAAQVPRALAIEHAYGPVIAVAQKNAALLEQLMKYPPDKIPAPLVAEAVHKIGAANLLTLSKIAPDLRFLQRVGPHLLALQQAVAAAPSQWQHWWWVDLGGLVAFVPPIFLLRGRWRPKRARQDYEEHERHVREELAQLELSASGVT